MTFAPGVQAALDELRNLPATPWATLTTAQADAYLTTARQPRPVAAPDPAVRTTELATPTGTPVRVYDAGQQGPLLVYLHGGGWVMGDLNLNDPLCRTWARDCGFVVVSVDYRLAPEHPFPVPLDDAYAATRWAAEHASALRARDSREVVIAGSSAGGNLAAAVAIKALDNRDLSLAVQVLIYPCLDDALDTRSYKDFASGYYLDREQMRWYWRQYLPGGADRSSPLAVPARRADLTGLPPAVVITAEYDPLRDEGAAYARRLEAARVPVRYRCYTGQIHGFLGLPDVIPGARSAAREIGADIRALLAESP